MAVTPDTVADALGRPLSSDSAERRQIAYWISGAELLIRARLGDLALLDQEALAWVLTEAVVARSRNPEAYASETESIDDYSRTYRMASETRQVTILDEWWELLSPTATTGAFTIRPWSLPARECW